MKKILITRKLIQSSEKYASSLFDTKLNIDDKLLMPDDLINQSNDCDGILSTLSEKIDENIISKLSNKIKIEITKLHTIRRALCNMVKRFILNQ